MTNPLVSICIPTYNGEPYLRECLDSAISQTYKNLEILVVDDKSEDRTIPIILEYQEKDSRIKLYRNTVNLGLVENWNKCLVEASGEWIKFLFQDDILYPECIEKMLSSADSKAGMVVCNRGFSISKDTPQLIRDSFELQNRTLQTLLNINKPQFISPKVIAKIVSKFVYSNFIGEPTAVMLRKSTVSELGMFNPDLVQICDLEYWLRIASNFGLYYIPEELALFRVHEQSTSAANRYSFKGEVDRFILIYLFMTNDYYRNLRSNISKFRLFKFNEMFKIKIYETNMLLRDKKELQSHYNLIKTSFPLISKYETPSWRRKLIFYFVKLKRKIF